MGESIPMNAEDTAWNIYSGLPAGENLMITCPECKTNCKTAAADLEFHTKSQMCRFKCHYCVRTFVSKYSMKEHAKKKHVVMTRNFSDSDKLKNKERAEQTQDWNKNPLNLEPPEHSSDVWKGDPFLPPGWKCITRMINGKYKEYLLDPGSKIFPGIDSAVRFMKGNPIYSSQDIDRIKERDKKVPVDKEKATATVVSLSQDNKEVEKKINAPNDVHHHIEDSSMRPKSPKSVNLEEIVEPKDVHEVTKDSALRFISKHLVDSEDTQEVKTKTNDAYYSIKTEDNASKHVPDVIEDTYQFIKLEIEDFVETESNEEGNKYQQNIVSGNNFSGIIKKESINQETLNDNVSPDSVIASSKVDLIPSNVLDPILNVAGRDSFSKTIKPNEENLSHGHDISLEPPQLVAPCVLGTPPHNQNANNPFQGLFHDRGPGMAAFAFYVEECWTRFGRMEFNNQSYLETFYQQCCQSWTALTDEARELYWRKEMTYFPKPNNLKVTPPVATLMPGQNNFFNTRESLRNGSLTKRGKGRPKAKVIKDANAPKGNCQAFFYFAKQYRAKLSKEMADNRPTVVSKELGKRWRELPDEEKLKYLKMAGEDRKRYEREKMIYEAKKAWQENNVYQTNKTWREKIWTEQETETNKVNMYEIDKAWREKKCMEKDTDMIQAQVHHLTAAIVGQKEAERRTVIEWKKQQDIKVWKKQQQEQQARDAYLVQSLYSPLYHQHTFTNQIQNYSVWGEKGVAVSGPGPDTRQQAYVGKHWIPSRNVRRRPYSPYNRQTTGASSSSTATHDQEVVHGAK